ncbi:MAG TPA: DUF2157 domain-containing protein [Ideonella sp.]|nr:DUF2157 domain-containing protein [Ideonella sp.]
MNRQQLDTFSHQHRLAAPAIAAALDLTGQRPALADWRAFAVRLLRGAGLGGVGAGMLFFVAANWQDYGVLGRFVLLQTALLVCVGIALWRPAPAPQGQGSLLLATLLTGGLLALFGQSYQTGADVYELFFIWALLALPFALAGLSGALWATWCTVLNLGLALLCGSLGQQNVFWRSLGGWQLDDSVLLMLPCLVNLAGAGLFAALHRGRFALAAPPWLAQFLAAIGLAYGTAATLAALLDRSYDGLGGGFVQQAVVVLVFAAISVALGLATWRRKRDVFPMALLAASWIVISTSWLVKALSFNDLGSFFLVTLWLIAASTATGMQLMRWQRAWRGPAPATAVGDAA